MGVHVKIYLKVFVGVVGSAVLAACGGGGGGGTPAPTGPVVSTLSFPLQSAVNSETASGSILTLHATGTSATQVTDGLCTGTVTQTDGPATTATTFEGSPALSRVSVVTITFTNCTPASTTGTETDYFNSNYVARGLNIQGGKYGVYLTAPVIPSSVTVGATGIIGTLTYYTDSTKASGAGRSDKSFVIEADTATTAIANAITKTYDASGTLTSTSQSRYRIDASGAFTPVSIDIQYSGTSTTHLVFR